MAYQKCPSCGSLNDVGIYVSGTRVQCAACRLPFRVEFDQSVQANPAQVKPRTRRREAPRPPVDPGRPAGEKRPGARRPIPPHPAVEQQPPSPRKPEPPVEQPPPKAAQNTVPNQGELSIPGFKLYEVIGKGGMGKVYRAMQESLNRIVAIKVLNEDLAKHKSFIRRFEKETASLATLHHANISTIYDRGNAGSIWYFVMEYIDGPSLRHKVNRGRTDMAEALTVFGKLCKAVAHAHQRGVIHRDLKPENVLFTSEGELKVVDFGLANILDEDRRWSMTRTKVSMGTVNYMAPEQRRDAKNVTHMADIYSLGVMLYELLTGELPLGRFEPPSKHRPEVDPRLDQLVFKMLDFDPDERPQQADLVAITVDAVLADLRGLPKPVAAPAPAVAATPPPAAAEKPPSGPPSIVPTPASGRSLRPRPNRRRRRVSSRVSRAILLLLGGLLILGGGAAAVFFLLLGSDVSTTTGDLVLRQDEDGLQLSLVHPHQVMHVPPAGRGSEADGGKTRFDFRQSRLAPVPVRLVGGNWLWDDAAGVFSQDTCRSAFTVNQHPAIAAFGESASAPEGLTLAVTFKTSPSTWDAGAGPISMQEYLREHLADAQRLARVDAQGRIGLGFVDKRGEGLKVVVPLESGTPAKLLRSGAMMEGESLNLDGILPAGLNGQAHQLRMLLLDGRVKVELDDKVILDELAGFALDFKGYPALACQNAACEFRSLSYSK